MKNIITTIPKAKFSSWKVCERVLLRCIGEPADYWLINTPAFPRESGIGAVCFMVYDGLVRGYMDIVDLDESENYRDKHNIGRRRNTKCIVMANWHPIKPVLMGGFQGYRYTEMRP